MANSAPARGLVPICFDCRRFRGVTPDIGFTCEAFQNRSIPVEILASCVDHRKPYEGDGGLQYQAKRSASDVQWSEQEHPRASGGTSKGGRFIKAAAGAEAGVPAAKKTWLQRPRAAARAGTAMARQRAGEFSHPDYHIIREALKPKSEPRKRWASQISGLAKSVPSLLRSHVAEEREKAVHAAGALKAMATGNKPSPEQFKGLRSFGVRILMSAASMVTFGDPTGTVGHIAVELAQEIVHHVIAEHGARLASGIGRLAIGRDAAIDDVALLRAFIEDLAKAAEHFEPQSKPRLVSDVRWLSRGASDYFKEEEHPRAAPGGAKGGQFVSKGEGGGSGGGEETEQLAPSEPSQPEKNTRPSKTSSARRQPEQTFISPNTGELNFVGAQHELTSKRQHVLEQISEAIDRRLGLRAGRQTNVIGAWADGAENSLMAEVSGDHQLIRAAAAMKGWIAEQKAVLVFKPDERGDQYMAKFELKGSLEKIHSDLLRSGLQFHTLEPTPGGAIVHIFASDQDTLDAVERTASAAGADVRFVAGSGEFIGTALETGSDEEQRANARQIYERVFEEAARSGSVDERNLKEVWRDADNHWRAATGAAEGIGLVGSQGHPALVSTRRPTVKSALESDRYRRPDLASMRQDEKNFAHDMELLRNPIAYPNFRPDEVAGSPDEIATAALGHAKANLRFLYESAPKQIREQGHLWYEGANQLAKQQADKYGLPLQSAAGVFAALSPQKLWDMNVYLAERTIEIHQTQQDHRWDDKMEETAAQIWKPKDRPVVDLIRNKSLAELTTTAEKAMWIRTYDEAHSNRQFDRLSPDGRRLGPYLTATGQPAKAAWQSTAAVANAVQALDSGGDRDVISPAMGNLHKARSFYNNILDPHSGNDDVTMDTHAVGAALLRPMTGNDVPVMHSLALTPEASKHPPGWQAASTSAVTGLQGLYGLWADAYRQTAYELGIEPRVLQSVTWEAKRALFDQHMTTAKKREVEQTWRDYHDGKADLAATQKAVLKIADGMAKP